MSPETFSAKGSKRFPSPHQALKQVCSPEHGIFASANELYGDGIFGRDAAEVAQDLLEHRQYRRRVVQAVITTLAKLQGTTIDPTREEEPGRIHHEYRASNIIRTNPSANGLRILEELARKWGGTKEELCYYGAVDATPLYVSLVMDHCTLYPEQHILKKKVRRKNGETSTIEESVRQAIDWIEGKLDASDLHLLEFHRTNPFGHLNQVWMDSGTSYVHEDGRLPNYNRPIASIEVQGFAYDALFKSARVLTEAKGEERLRWIERANALRAATVEHFWMENQQFFALGIDRDAENKPRKIATRSSNVGLLLDSEFFDTMEPQEKRMYVSGITERVYGNEFLTDVGVRCRSLSHQGIIDFADYHGSNVSWIKQTYDIAKGLRRQGFPQLAEQLEIRILNAITLSGDHYEFFYVDEKGRVHYTPNNAQDATNGHAECEDICGTNIPEGTQAWTVSAVLAIRKRMREARKQISTDTWQASMEEELLAKNPKATLLKSKREIRNAFPTHSFRVDIATARQREQRYHDRIASMVNISAIPNPITNAETSGVASVLQEPSLPPS